MRLPVLVEKKPEDTLHRSTCDGGANCPSCSLFHRNGGRCEGCTASHRAQVNPNFAACYKECNTCTGYKVAVTAICCRSPLKDTYLTAVAKGSDYNNPAYAYTKQPVLSFKNKAVFYISSGGVNTIAAPGELLMPDLELAAVNLTRVWGSNGFYSNDLKDYLRLSAKTKLLLVTMCHDDLLERAFQQEFYADPQSYQRAGIDYWHPLAFSAYPEEAHMHQYYQTLRTLYCTERSQAHFVTGDHFLTGVRTDDLILAALERIPQMMFNTQFVGANEVNLRYSMRVLKHYHQIAPAHVPFWLVGTTSATFVANARKQCGARTLYFLSPRPLYVAAKGRALTLYGKDEASKLPKLDLLKENYAMFTRTIQEYA